MVDTIDGSHERCHVILADSTGLLIGFIVTNVAEHLQLEPDELVVDMSRIAEFLSANTLHMTVNPDSERKRDIRVITNETTGEICIKEADEE